MTEADLDRATRPVFEPPAAPPLAVGLAAIEVDITDLAGERAELLAAIAEAALHGIRATGAGAVTDIVLARGTEQRIVAGAHDLTVAALARRFAEPAPSGPGAAPRLRVVDAAELAFQLVPPRPDEVAAVAVGAVTDRVHAARGGISLALAVRRTVTVTLSTSALGDADVAAVLAGVRRLVATA